MSQPTSSCFYSKSKIYQSYTIDVGENIPLGDIYLSLDITAEYIEDGQEIDFQDQTEFSMNVNLLQKGFPFFTTSQVSGAPTVTDLNQDGVINVLDKALIAENGNSLFKINRAGAYSF